MYRDFLSLLIILFNYIYIIKAVPDKFGGMILLILSLIIFFSFNIFIINNYYFFFSYNANYKNTIFIIYILYIIGILSVNVTLLFPFLHQLQFIVLIYLIFFGIKI